MRHEHRRFSPRQLEVAVLLADGLRSPAIAEVLGIAPNTVRTHFAYLRMFTNRHTITGAIAVLIREGWIE